MGTYYNASDLNWNAPDSREHFENPWICSYSSNWAFYYPNNCSWVFDNERLTLETLRKLENMNISSIGRGEAAGIRLKRKIASYLLFQHATMQVEEECFYTVGRDVVEEDGQSMQRVYTVEYDEEISGLPTVSDESISEVKPFYAHPTKPLVSMARSYSHIRNYKFEESFKTVGVLVSDEEDEVTLPIVYIVAFDEELFVPSLKNETKSLEVKESQRVVMKKNKTTRTQARRKQQVCANKVYSSRGMV